MSIGYSGNMELELAALDRALEESLRADRVRPIARRAPETAPLAPSAAPAATAPDWNSPASELLWHCFWRAARTTSPFILADLLALALCGLGAQWILWRLYPQAFSLPGWTCAVALLPLVVAYWLSGLYSEIWVHPVIEFRQLTRVSSIALVAAAAGAMAAPPLPLWCAAALPAVLVLVPLLRTVARHCCVDRLWWGYPTLVIGSGDGAAALVRMVLECPR